MDGGGGGPRHLLPWLTAGTYGQMDAVDTWEVGSVAAFHVESELPAGRQMKNSRICSGQRLT